MSGFENENTKPAGGKERSEPPRGGNAGSYAGPHAGPYAAPRVTRVRIETSRMTLGYQDAVQYCTIHDHDTGINPCTIN